MDVDSARDNHTQDLFTGPEWFGFDYRRCGNVAVPVWEPKEYVLDLCPVEECISEGKFADTTERILDDAHDGLVGLR